MTVRIVPQAAMEFPAITLCNLNPIRKSALIKLQQGNNPTGETVQSIGENMGSLDTSGNNMRRKRSMYKQGLAKYQNKQKIPSRIPFKHDNGAQEIPLAIYLEHSGNSRILSMPRTKKRRKRDLKKRGKKKRKKRAAGKYMYHYCFVINPQADSNYCLNVHISNDNYYILCMLKIV